jgi:putative tryptophan/tyrosine transport system substrate-binding protein
MRRREFIAGLASTASAIANPIVGRTQSAVPVIGHLGDGAWTPVLKAAFARGLAETGYVEGRNLAIENRFSDKPEKLAEFAVELVHRRVNVIVTPGSLVAALAAQAATTSIPIVFGTGTDPVQIGLVTSLNRPGGNITGYTEMQVDVVSKRFGLLRQLAPATMRYAALIDPRNPTGFLIGRDAQAAGEAIGARVEVVAISDDAQLERIFLDRRADALLISPGTFFFVRRNRVIELTASHAIPAAYWLREFPEAGGLMSYGSSIAEMFRQVGIQAGRILKGTNPADLPVTRATKFELVINLKTAKALGLTIPETLLATADEVIQQRRL